MGLKDYIRKRQFSKTPEPKPAPVKPHHKLRFVVQEHHASRLHYDFRLELDGVLKSWAVPKGPSLDPHEHRLAVQTEDHPFDYRKFEGVIPEGNYGAGNVIIWDEGWYEPRQSGDDTEKLLQAGLKKGHLTFILHGKKLNGEFALIKMPDAKEDNAWLLVKKDDAYASADDITKKDESIKSRKKVDELPGGFPDISSCPKSAMPKTVKPMLCTLIDEPFDKTGWLFEIKWDGYRAIGSKQTNEIGLRSRNNLDFLDKYPAVAEALRSFKHDVMVDGEIVVVDDDGVAHFEWLQDWNQQQRHGTILYYVFDILWCDGRDVRNMPLISRKSLLKGVLPKNTVLRYSDHIEAEGSKLFKEIKRRGMEGIVAKREDSAYHGDTRGADWLKIKTTLRQEVVIGGYTEPRGGRKFIGSLLTGVYDEGSLKFAGHSGGGIPDDERKALLEKLSRLERKSSPFTTIPKPNAPVHWVRPELVCEMSFSEWTQEGLMRHPQFEGMRSDKDPRNVRREKPENITPRSSPAAKQSGLPFELTHLDKVFFPKHKYTKGDLIEYYKSVAEYILPYLKDRPLSMNRMPDGIQGPSFFQKNNEHLPEWVPSADIFSDSNNTDLHWIVGGDLQTLLYIVQLGSIEINPWNSRIGRLDKPDWIVIDLDPEGVSFEKVIEVAQAVKTVCDEWKIPSYPKTSGKTGLHVFIPMQAKYSFEQCKNLAHLIALEVNTRTPDITSVERMPEKRKHRIYVDFLQNREGQTLAAPYSVRPTPDASVSMPLRWDEVKPGLKPSDFTIKNAPTRLNRVGDLWKPVTGKGIDLPAILKRIELNAAKNQ